MLFRFEYPLVLLAIPILVGLLYYFTKPRSVISFCLRLLIIILLVFMVAGFQIKAPPQNTCRIYLIDDSSSVFLDKDRLLASINENIKQLSPNDVTRILYLNPTDDRTGTNIEKALLTAKGTFPSGYRKEIFLFSDGNQTEGDAKKVIPYLKQEGITLYTIPIGPKEVVDIKIDSVEAPKFVREGQPIELKCRVSSTVNTAATVQVFGNGKLIRELKEVPLLKNQDNSVAIILPAQIEPVQTYEVKISFDRVNDATTDNNYWTIIIQKFGKPKVLYLSGAHNLAKRTLPGIIQASDNFMMKVEDAPVRYKLYDIIIIDDTNFSKMLFVEEIIKPFVLNGGGLLVVGGDNSFGLGDYQNSELEKILPVYATPPEDLSLVIIQDASGSMDEFSGVGSLTKFQLASDALQNAIPILSKTDRLEVMVFNQGYQTILPLQNADDIIPKLKEEITKVKPTGPTAIIPPLQKAISTLSNISSAKKHIILLSDGYSTTNESLDGFKQIAEKLGQNNITISVIATGDHINEGTLKVITKEESIGKIYRIIGKDSEELMHNLRQDLSINKEFYREAESLPVSALIKSDVLKGIDNIPPISGYNRTTLKPNARLVASIGDKEPLMADWQYGLGRVMVLTTSLDSQWMGAWNKWDRLGQMITQALRYLTIDTDQNQLSNIVTETLADGRIELAVEAPDNLELDAQVESLTEGITYTKTIRLAQVAVGKYEAILPSQKEDVVISIFFRKDSGKQLLGRVPVVKQYAKEWRKFTPDIGFLRDMAESIGGKLLTVDEFAKGNIQGAVNNKSEPAYRNINAILILAALGIFLIDLLLRSR